MNSGRFFIKKSGFLFQHDVPTAEQSEGFCGAMSGRFIRENVTYVGKWRWVFIGKMRRFRCTVTHVGFRINGMQDSMRVIMIFHDHFSINSRIL
jgi:hypothetical protein